MASDFFMSSLNHSSDSIATIVTPLCGSFVTMVDYGERLQKAMDESGVSVNMLADELGASYQAVKKVLNGASNAFNAINHVKAARFLGVSSDWLALGEGEMRQQTGCRFRLINEAKVRNLPPSEFDRLEASLAAVAHGINLDILNDRPTDIDTGS